MKGRMKKLLTTVGRIGLISDGDGWNVGNSKVSGDFFTQGTEGIISAKIAP